jgi:hypothetical protein
MGWLGVLRQTARVSYRNETKWQGSQAFGTVEGFDRPFVTSWHGFGTVLYLPWFFAVKKEGMTMALSYADFCKVGYEVTELRNWEMDGHAVVLIRLKDTVESRGLKPADHLICGCDRTDGDEETDAVGSGRAEACPAKKAVRDVLMAETRQSLAPLLALDGLKAAILEIHRRTEAGEHLGQSMASVMYVQEAAKILGVPDGTVWAACDELYGEEKLDLNGAIFAAFDPCFRLPKEMAAVMAYFVEEPLGWPNGDAGMSYVAEFQSKVQAATGFTSGRAAFGKHWPHVDKRIVADFALDWLGSTLDAAASSAEGMAEVRALTAEALAVPGRKLESGHPEISAKVFAMYLLEMVQMAFERIKIESDMSKGRATPEETLRNLAKYFAGLAEQFRQSPAT